VAPPIGASLLATWLIARAGGWHWSQVLNSFYAYMAATIAVAVLGKRVLPERVADPLTALSLGLWLGATDGFWKGAAYLAIMITALFASAFLVELAPRLWRSWRARSTRH
jgi:hypothetical protein